MTENHYTTELEAIETIYKNAKTLLGFEFAKSKRQFAIGDCIKDVKIDISIKIDKISWGKGNLAFPYPIYSGTCLTKKLELKKNSERASIFATTHENIIKLK